MSEAVTETQAGDDDGYTMIKVVRSGKILEFFKSKAKLDEKCEGRKGSDYIWSKLIIFRPLSSVFNSCPFSKTLR